MFDSHRIMACIRYLSRWCVGMRVGGGVVDKVDGVEVVCEDI